jgi:hypothetical protein
MKALSRRLAKLVCRREDDHRHSTVRTTTSGRARSSGADVNARLKSRLERLESHVIPVDGERQTMDIQFISREKVVTSTLSVILGTALPSQTGKLGRRRRV